MARALIVVGTSLALAGCGGLSLPTLPAPPPASLADLNSGSIDGFDDAKLQALKQQNGTDYGDLASCTTALEGALRDLLVDSNGDLFSGVEDVRVENNPGSSMRYFAYGTVTYGSPLPPRPGEPPNPSVVMKAGHMFQCDGGVLRYMPPPPPPSAPPRR